MRKTESILALAAILVLAGCSQGPATGTDSASEADASAAVEVVIAEGLNLEAEIVGHAWALVSMDGEALAEGEPPTMTLAEDGRIAGFGGCNRYFGAYELEGDKLEVSDLGATKMACPPPQMGLEDRFFECLEAARYLTLEGSQLTLTGDEGALVFTQQESELPEQEPPDTEPA